LRPSRITRRATSPCIRHRLTVLVETLNWRLTSSSVSIGSAASSTGIGGSDRSTRLANRARSCLSSAPGINRSWWASGR
jgi:hypothetical protein